MARTDAIVLGAGIVGTSVALHLARRGMSVALVDRAAPGEQTSFGNAGIIEGNTVFPPTFPSDPATLIRIVFKRAALANYHLSCLPPVAPWVLEVGAGARPKSLNEFGRLVRPPYASAGAGQEDPMAGSGATQYLRKSGWLKVYRKESSFRALHAELDLAAEFG